MNAKLEELHAQDRENAAAIQQNMLKKNSDVKTFPFDVSGKNDSASLLTVTLGSIFSMLSLRDSSNLAPSQLIVMLDNFIKEIVLVGNVITGAVCYVDYKAKSVSVYNCGHTNVLPILRMMRARVALQRLLQPCLLLEWAW